MQPSRIVLCVLLGLAAACSSATKPHAAAPAADTVETSADAASTPLFEVLPGTQVRMRLGPNRGFWDGPFPSDDLRDVNGVVQLPTFPDPNQVPLLGQALALLAQEHQGFSLTAPIFLSLTGPIDESRLPDAKGSLDPSAKVFLVDATRMGERHPVVVHFEADGGPNGTTNLLSILPLQGVPLHPDELYVAVVLRSLNDAADEPLGRSQELADLLNDPKFADYGLALHLLKPINLPLDNIAGLAVFTTGHPAGPMATARTAILNEPTPLPGPWTRTDVFDEYCVYQTTIDMPDYQSGTPPFQTSGGGWLIDHATAAPVPILQRHSTSSLFVTIPRKPMPDNGFPPTVFVRTGGGGDRPLVDRGVQPGTGQPTPKDQAGTGPAMWFAKAGFAGIQVDGPLGGLRNVTHADEQFLIFNVMNAEALRDNIRESALELMLLAHIVPKLQLDTSDCPGASASAHFDDNFLSLMGHSTGAWIAQLVLAFEPAYKLAILSGAGSSYLENIVHKLHPVATRPIAESLLGYDTINRTLTDHDPALMLVEWAAEPSDPQVYNHPAQAHHVLMLQGIVDGYILPAIANPTTLSMGLDLAGDALDAKSAEEKALNQTSILDLLPFVGRKQLTLPVTGNRDGKYTTVVVQHPGDGIEDGHEVVFQTEPPKHQIICFLKSFLTGVPTVVPLAGLDAPCP